MKRFMNIQEKISKLLMALSIKGYIIKINTYQFYAKEKERLVTKYILWETHPKEGEVFYSKIDVLKRLIELYKEVGGADG